MLKTKYISEVSVLYNLFLAKIKLDVWFDWLVKEQWANGMLTVASWSRLLNNGPLYGKCWLWNPAPQWELLQADLWPMGNWKGSEVLQFWAVPFFPHWAGSLPAQKHCCGAALFISCNHQSQAPGPKSSLCSQPVPLTRTPWETWGQMPKVPHNTGFPWVAPCKSHRIL